MLRDPFAEDKRISQDALQYGSFALCTLTTLPLNSLTAKDLRTHAF